MAQSSTSIISIATIKVCLVAIGAITTTHYEDTSSIIFNSDCFAGVVKIEINSRGTFRAFWGSSWTSGSTIVGSTVLMAVSEGSGQTGNKIAVCRVAGKLFAINQLYSSNTHVSAGIVGKLTTGDTFLYGTDTSNPGANPCIKNTVNGLSSDPLVPYHKVGGTILAASGNYLMANIDRIENYKLISDNFQNIKILCRPRTIVDVGLPNGNNVIITGGKANGDENYMPYDLLIIDGAI